MRKLLLSMAAVLAALLAVEGGLRLQARRQGLPWSASEARIDAQRLTTSMLETFPDVNADEEHGNQNAIRRNESSGAILHPFTGFDLKTTPKVVDSILQSQPNRTKNGTVEILVFGGSVAANFSGERNGVSDLTEQLFGELDEYRGRPVRVINMARAGFKQPQQLTKLNYLLARGMQPEIVLNLDGYNEVHLSVRNALSGYRLSWPSFGHWSLLSRQEPLDDEALAGLGALQMHARRAEAIDQRARRYGFYSSAILGRWSLGQIRAAHADWVEAQAALVEHLEARTEDPVASTDEGPELLQRHVDESVRLWAESSRLMHQVCQARGIRYLHALQPTLHDEGSKPVHPRELERGLQGGGPDPEIVAGYRGLRQAGAELAAEGVEFIDCSLAFEQVEEPLYYDRCHFVQWGNELVLRQIVEALKE